MESKKNNGDAVFLPVLPLKNLVALPKSIIPVVVGRDISIKAVEHALAGNKEVFITAQRVMETEKPEPNDVYDVGTRGIILQVSRMSNGTLKIFVEGIVRSRIEKFEEGHEFLAVMAQDLPSEFDPKASQIKALWRNIHALFEEYIGLNDKVSSDVLTLFKGPEDLDYFTDTVAVQMHLDLEDRQKVLEIVDVRERAMHVCVLLKKETEILLADRNIRQRVQSQVEKHQKDYYLNEQIRAIHRELGRDDYQKEIQTLRDAAQAMDLPEEAEEKVEAELRRLEQMQPSSPESAVSRNYIDWVLGLPWEKSTKDDVSITEAEEILNKTHASMKKIKDRVIEFIAARKFAGNKLKRAPIICLAGPPGVGKTSLAQSIADALGRTMVRISLGGMRDEAEIRGHRRTYIGAMPGKIIQSMKKAKVNNPVILLDEIDKMAMDFRGDPSSALLEVLDPEQNKNFSDYFLEIDYDLSRVLFITTANVVDAIPYPLLDRMEIIQLSGYTDIEKLEIAQNFLVPKLLKEYNLKETQVAFGDKVLQKVIEEYTKEAGVRQLERVIAKLLRKSIQKILEDGKKKAKKITIDQEMVVTWLGPEVFRRDDYQRVDAAGVATGLAWTEVGGDILDIEVTILKGKGALTLTGQLGEVMQESAQAAMSYVRSRAKDFGLKADFYSEIDAHIHVPEGAIPKDGPSAGITMCIALLSALTGIEVRRDVAMTGEITLRGRVLAVGGIKEKLLAAIRFGFKRVIVPKSIEKDVQEVAGELDASLEIVYVEKMDEVVNAALIRSPFAAEQKKAKRTAGVKSVKSSAKVKPAEKANAVTKPKPASKKKKAA